MSIFFSAATGGFYDDRINAEMPSDAVQITSGQHTALLQGQADGKRIIASADGLPVLADSVPLTEDELAQLARQAWKAQRQAQVAAITVKVDDMPFDGDETSQTRMSRAVIGLQGDETIRWVLADNSVAQVTKAQLLEAMRLSGQQQAALWIQE